MRGDAGPTREANSVSPCILDADPIANRERPLRWDDFENSIARFWPVLSRSRSVVSAKRKPPATFDPVAQGIERQLSGD